MKLDRMPTGIPGLDRLLDGGIVRGNSFLVEGPPGSGKSTFGLRMLAEGVQQFDEAGLLISFEEFPRQIYEDAASYGVDLRTLEATGRFRVIWTPPGRIVDGFNGRSDLIDQVVERLGVRRLVIDSITHFKRVTSSDVELRELLATILNKLKLQGINTILIKELEHLGSDRIAFEEYLVDASMRLHNRMRDGGGANVRYLEIRKTRGQGHLSGLHPFTLGELGLRVFPHLTASHVEGRGRGGSAAARRVTTGIDGLDAMLAGGLLPGSVTQVTGYAGTGKSVIGYHALRDGLTKGERCLVVSTSDTPERLHGQALSLGMDWNHDLADGRLAVRHVDPRRICAEELIHQVAGWITESSPSRLVLDSVTDVWQAGESVDRSRTNLAALARLLESARVTSLLLAQTHDMGGAELSGAAELTSLATTVIQLSMAEVDGSLRRFVGVRKHAGSDHAKELRELTIDAAGMRVQRKATGLSGILTGQTRGALTQVADEVIPALEEASRLLREATSSPDVPASLKTPLRSVYSNLGLLDVLLREHFGLTAFHREGEEWEGNPPTSAPAA